MKVTISFDDTKIVVPCGDGDITVRELTRLAVTRYKKAIGKPSNYWVSVSNLKSCYEGGMLDPDDLICDVCDDREQLIAVFEEQSRTGHHLGDGMSSEESSDCKEHNPAVSGHPMQPRRGSEPNLMKGGSNLVTAGTVQAAVASFNAITKNSSNNKSRSSITPRSSSSQLLSDPKDMQEECKDFFIRPTPVRSSLDHGRSSLRMTMVHGATNLYKDADVMKAYHFNSQDFECQEDADNLDSLNFDSKCSLNVMRRREPLGASGNKPERTRSPSLVTPTTTTNPIDITILIQAGPLGIHVVPCNHDGRLVVQGIEPGGRVDRDGRLAVGDEIIAINGACLKQSSFTRAQEIFKDALSAKELHLTVLKVASTNEEMAVEEGSNAVMDNKENICETDLCSGNLRGSGRYYDSDSGTLTKMAAGTKITTAVNANNTRKIGKVLKIMLKKGALGLGFSITTRDNSLGTNPPIYIKNILPKGAAIEEGTLKPGDRLLEVSGVSVDGMSQSEVVALLRNIAMDSSVELVVSRHIIQPLSSPEVSSQPGSQATSAPSSLTKTAQTQSEEDNNAKQSLSSGMTSSGGEDASMEEFQCPWKQREILTFDIPVHDSERAGLGVSVKGKTSTSKDGEVVDLGIFVKSVLHGGAAFRDKRLRTNDQLVNINGISLLGKHNLTAMDTLRKAMHDEGPVPGIISLTVARRRQEDLSLTSSCGTSSTASSAVKEGKKRTDSLSSLITSSSDDMVREYNVSSSMYHFKMPVTSSLANIRNPVVDRLMGKDSAGVVPSNLRNESYYMATHQDTWMGRRDPTLPSLLHQMDQCETAVMIEQDSGCYNNPHDDEDDHTVTRESLTSLVEASYPAFSRDQPGRQSMSEKRHATLDAKATDTYQKRKKAREDRMAKQDREDKQSLWKKSASLESLQMDAVEREAMRNAYIRASSVRVSRHRGCNESFRAAVDRSYEHQNDDESEVLDNGDDDVFEDASKDSDVFQPCGNEVTLRRESCLAEPSDAAVSANKKKNRNSKLLKGLGTMFRIGGGGSGSSDKSNTTDRRSKSSSAANRKSLPGGVAVGAVTDVPEDYRQNFLMPKSRSGDLVSATSSTSATLVSAPAGRSGSATLSVHRSCTYDYYPSAMMRPGSRVGIADPAQLSTGSSDYDVLHRLQNRPDQFSSRTAPHPGKKHSIDLYESAYSHGVLTRPSNPHLSFGNGKGLPKPARPKSNFYEYDLYNPSSKMVAMMMTTSSSTSTAPTKTMSNAAVGRNPGYSRSSQWQPHPQPSARNSMYYPASSKP